MSNLLQCYNIGCGQKYDPETNTEESCQYHPGAPIFHDAKKKWSCCKKFSTDFSEFLSIKGCTKGKHSNVRPVEPEKPNLKTTDSQHTSAVPSVPAEPPRQPISRTAQPRPSATDPMQPLKVEVAASLTTLLEKMTLEKKLRMKHGDDDSDSAGIDENTPCQNRGCTATFRLSGTDLCRYHPGVPIFHEGMKFWSCCNRKTSDFNAFMEQLGCQVGAHNWKGSTKEDNIASESSTCRFDWFQLPGQVTITVYAKAVLPESVEIEANRVKLHVSFKFGSEEQRFRKVFHLFGVVDPAASVIKLMGTKVEIVLKKGEAMSWPNLSLVSPPTSDT